MKEPGLLFLQIAFVVVVTRLVGLVAERIRQPRVMGEIVAGLLIGPSLLGWLAPGLSAFLFPRESHGTLQALSQVGLMLFLFLVGLELDLGQLRALGRVAVVTSQVSIVLPLALGTAVGLLLPTELVAPSPLPLAPALFVGVALSVTAFPVLARILVETRLLRTPLGAVAIACAAVDDLSAWCLLAALSAYVRSGQEMLVLLRTGALLVAYAATMLFVVRPFIERRRAALVSVDGGFFALGMILLLLSSALTDAIGVHGLFGAFLAGVVMPRGGDVRTLFSSRLEGVTGTLLLPLFFAVTGLQADVTLVSGRTAWVALLAILVAAVAGKLGGTALAARFMGMTGRDALVLGLLLNTRGLVELVILNAGLDLGVVSPAVFSMMVLMAIVTTFMATPLVLLLRARAVEKSA